MRYSSVPVSSWTKAMQSDTLAKISPASTTRGWSGTCGWWEHKRLEQRTWSQENTCTQATGSWQGGQYSQLAHTCTDPQAPGQSWFECGASKEKGRTDNPPTPLSQPYQEEQSFKSSKTRSSTILKHLTHTWDCAMALATVEYIGSTTCAHLRCCLMDMVAHGCLIACSPHMVEELGVSGQCTQKTDLGGAKWMVLHPSHIVAMIKRLLETWERKVHLSHGLQWALKHGLWSAAYEVSLQKSPTIKMFHQMQMLVKHFSSNYKQVMLKLRGNICT